MVVSNSLCSTHRTPGRERTTDVHLSRKSSETDRWTSTSIYVCRTTYLLSEDDNDVLRAIYPWSLLSNRRSEAFDVMREQAPPGGHECVLRERAKQQKS